LTCPELTPEETGREEKKNCCYSSVNSFVQQGVLAVNSSLFDGVYVTGSIIGIPVDFTVDTGATRTIVSEDVYYRIPREQRPGLSRPKKGVQTANGGR